MVGKHKIDVASVSALAVAGAKRAWTEKEPVLLIGILEGAVMAAFFWPAVQLNFVALQLAGSSDTAAIEAFLVAAVALWPLYLLMMLFNAAVSVVIARLAAVAGAGTLAGGLPALARRLGWLLWRWLGAIGWILAGIVALWLFTIIINVPLSLVTGSGGDGGTGQVPLLEGIILFLLVGGLLVLSGALGLSLVSECGDHHLTIRRAWGLLQGQRMKMAAAIFLIYLVTAIANGMVMSLAPEGADSLEGMRLLLSALHVAVTIIGTFFTFIWFSMTTIVAEKIDWSEPDRVSAED